jgi:transcription termination factor NusB
MCYNEKEWPDVYDHCHRCEKIKQKVDMATIDSYHYCVDCVPVVFESQQTATNSIAKYAADLNSRVGYLEKAIVRAYEAKDWTMCLDALVKIHNDITQGQSS